MNVRLITDKEVDYLKFVGQRVREREEIRNWETKQEKRDRIILEKTWRMIISNGLKG